MGIAEREYMNVETPEETRLSLWRRFVRFTDRHAKAITFLATVAIIVAVLLLVQSFWHSARMKRAAREIHAAVTIEEMLKVKEQYKDVPLYPVLLYRLANRYQEEEKWDEAAKTYDEFFACEQNLQPLLWDQAKKAYETLKKNREWMEKNRDMELNVLKLQVGSAVGLPAADPRSSVVPVKEDHPQVRLTTSRGEITIELFEDEYPNTTANFLALVEGKSPYPDAVWKVLNNGERLQLELKKERPAHKIVAEKGVREPIAGSLVMEIADVQHNAAADFQILLKEVPDLKDRTIFGKVVAGMERLTTLKDGDTITEVVVVRKRKHPYTPVTLPAEQKRDDEKK